MQHFAHVELFKAVTFGTTPAVGSLSQSLCGSSLEMKGPWGTQKEQAWQLCMSAICHSGDAGVTTRRTVSPC